MRALALLPLLGCGRIDFDVRLGDAGVDTAPDAMVYACGALQQPASVTLSGNTYRYTGFDNSHANLANVAVTAFDASGAQLGTTTADGTATYSLTMPPGATRVDYTLATWFPSHIYSDRPLDRDIAGTDANLWGLGDAPLWDDVGMNSVYMAVGTPRDTARTTLNIAIRHCDGSAIPGIVIMTEPAAETIAYTTTSGVTNTATVLPHTNAVAFNQPPGDVIVHAVDPNGLLFFPDLHLTLIGGDENALTIMHPLQ